MAQVSLDYERGNDDFKIKYELIDEPVQYDKTDSSYKMHCGITSCQLVEKVSFDGTLAEQTTLKGNDIMGFIGDSVGEVPEMTFRHEVLVNETYLYEEKQWIQDVVCSDELVSKGLVNETTMKICNDNGYMDISEKEGWRMVWKDFVGIRLVPKQDYYVRHTANFKASTDSWSADYVPMMFGFSKPEMAWWNATWFAKRQINFYNDVVPVARPEEFVPFWLNTTGTFAITDCDEVRMVNSSEDGEWETAILDASDEANGNCLMAAVVNASSNMTAYLYYNSTVAAPSYTDRVVLTENATHYVISTASYAQLEFEKNSGSYRNADDKDGNLVIRNGNAGQTMNIIYASGGEVIGGTESDETCSVIENTTLRAIIECDAGEDSNSDGTCDAGETCVRWTFTPRYWEHKTIYLIGSGVWFGGSVNTNRVISQTYWNETGVGDNDFTPTTGVTAKSAQQGYVLSNTSIPNVNAIIVWNETDTTDFAIDGDTGSTNAVWIGRDAGVWGISGDITIEFRTMIHYGAASNDAGEVENFKFLNPLLYQIFDQEVNSVELAPAWFSNASSVPANYSLSTYSTFNITWDNASSAAPVDMTAVNFTLNYSGSAVDYTATNISGDEWSGVYGYQKILGAGIYTWSSEAKNNETVAQVNTTDTWTFTVAQTTPICNLDLSPASPILYGTTLTATCNCNNAEGTIKLYRNHSDVTAENNSAVTLGVGGYNYVCNSTATGNYTVSTNNSDYTVTIAHNPINMWIGGYLNQNTTVGHGDLLNVTVQQASGQGTNITLYREEVLANSSVTDTTYYHNSSEPNSAVIAFKVNATGNANYSVNATGLTYYATISSALTLDCLDELTETGITFNITISNATHSETSYNNADYTSSGSTPSGDAVITVWALGYPQRTYFMYLNVSDITTLNTYLLATGEGQTVLLKTYTLYDQPIFNVSIDIQRLLAAGWTTIAQGRTDTVGSYPFFLSPSTTYRMNLEKEGYTTRNITIIPALTEYIIRMVGVIPEIPSFWEYWRTLSYACNYTNSSRLLQCNWTDTSSAIQLVTLEVWETNLSASTLLCENTSAAASGSFNCTFPSPWNQTYMWSFKGDFEDTSFLMLTGSWTDILQVLFGTIGVITALLLVLTTGFIGIQTGSPVMTLMMTVFGVGAAYIMGLLTIGTATIAGLFGLMIVAGILASEMRQ